MMTLVILIAGCLGNFDRFFWNMGARIGFDQAKIRALIS
jgi:hypothetical protein